MIKYNNIKSVVDKLINDEINYSLFQASLEEKVKAWKILLDFTTDGEMLFNNFNKLKKNSFFDSEEEEEEYKNLSESLQIFYYLIFKKYTQI